MNVQDPGTLLRTSLAGSQIRVLVLTLKVQVLGTSSRVTAGPVQVVGNFLLALILQENSKNRKKLTVFAAAESTIVIIINQRRIKGL